MSDTHCGSPVGLLHGSWQLHDGGTYQPSAGQRIIWKQYTEGISNAKKDREGKRLIVIFNGDPVEGRHHDTTQLITSRIEDQEAMHIDIMDWTLTELGFDDKAGDLLYYITGTEAHGDNGSQSDERIASQFDGIQRMSKGRATWDRLLLKCNGYIFDVAHQGANPGSRAWTKENALHNTLKSIYFDCLDSGAEIPDYWIRAHVHTYVPDHYQGQRKTVYGVLMPALQLKTEYAYKNHAMKMADIGLIYFIVGDSVDFRPQVMSIRQDKVVKV